MMATIEVILLDCNDVMLRIKKLAMHAVA